ncbi:NADPH:quinone reductase-like Zn-dependent oxidoreductase [Phyllobacterium sp. 1468]|uniref:NADPH:quinone reductase n=1 Tax=Phyllobacterium sp. 1468 TaxID=2817759 RepID=UPI002863D06E|nr:NADPH:quinone reductase [Phyllobacterium sp. 1468]MDR6632634.1 NADPH:quinone reductase-like Zn-dependent oxidoreductase [Phyllobacterium sp. 1468]
MRAAYYERQGTAADVLALGELPDPQPGPGEVRVRIHVSGVNPTDIKGRTGFGGAPMPFSRIIPHQDGAGIIDAVGKGVSNSRLGERVWVYEAQAGRPGGTAAELTVVPSERAVPLPNGVPFEIGASLGISALTAHRCLFADGDLKGRRVLVQGGAGAVGTAAILLAKWAGAWVATTVSRPEQEDVVRAAGADLIINRRTDDIAAKVRAATNDAGVDRIIEVDVVANIEVDMACIAPSGVISSYATENPAAKLSIPFLKAMFKGLVLRFVFVYSVPAAAKLEAIQDINNCMVAGAYHPAVGACFPLDAIVEAHETQETGRVVGKVLVKVFS